MKIDYEKLAEDGADAVCDYTDEQQAASMAAYVRSTGALTRAWNRWADAQETERLTKLAEEAQDESADDAHVWRRQA